MQLLEKTRRIGDLLRKNNVIEYGVIADLLEQIVGASVYIVDADGAIMGFAVRVEYERDELIELARRGEHLPAHCSDYLKKITGSQNNIEGNGIIAQIEADDEKYQADKRTAVVPIVENGERLATLLLVRYGKNFDDEDMLLAEYAATIIGVGVQREKEFVKSEEVRKKAMVQIAFSTLSFSEWEAIVSVLSELEKNEGILVASKIADRVGITRSVIVNAMRKFESAGLIETKSLGMKGTYIKVKNEYLLEEISRK